MTALPDVVLCSIAQRHGFVFGHPGWIPATESEPPVRAGAQL